MQTGMTYMNQFCNKNSRHSEFISGSPRNSRVILKPKEILKQVQDDEKNSRMPLDQFNEL